MANLASRARRKDSEAFSQTNFFVGVKRQMDVFRDFRAGLSPRAVRRTVGPAKIGGFPGPERLLIPKGHRVQGPKREALGASVPLKRNFQVCKFFCS